MVYGAALVLGKISVNSVVAHRRNLFRCSPEQLRYASSDEKTIGSERTSEGVKTLLEKGQFPKSQFFDLVNQDTPDAPEQVADAVRQDAVARSAGELVQQPGSRELEQESVPAASGTFLRLNRFIKVSECAT